jgi:PAS domain S-box-containing protein
MLNTHWHASKHRPADRELRFLDDERTGPAGVAQLSPGVGGVLGARCGWSDQRLRCGPADRETGDCPDVETSEFLAGSEDLEHFRRSGIRSVQATPLVTRSGRIVGMLSTHWREPHQPSERDLIRLDVLARQVADVIGPRQAEVALRASEEQFRRAIEDAPIPIIMHAEDGQVLQISKAWTELTGYGQQDMRDFNAWQNHAYGEGADAVRRHMQGLFKGHRRSLNVTGASTRPHRARRATTGASSSAWRSTSPSGDRPKRPCANRKSACG